MLLLLISILINYYLAIRMEEKRKAGKQAAVYVVICFLYNIGILWLFKYLEFTINGVNLLLHTNMNAIQLALPVGISFFTFKSISYCLDVYYQTVEAERNLMNVALYISFFPQITNGPVQTYHSFVKNISNKKTSLEMIGKGVRRFILGLGKKVIIADNIAGMVTDIFSREMETVSVMLAWMGIIGWLIQLYFDFAGYSDMAIGVGLAFGFECEENFNYPYISKSIGEYWRRWHISLGNWFNEYFYIPVFRKLLEIKNPFTKKKFGVLEGDIIALAVVWIFTGLWHGANMTYVVWGIYNGIFIIMERLIKRYEKQKRKKMKLPKKEETVWASCRKHVITILIVAIGQVIFKSESLSDAMEYLCCMFGAGSGAWVSKDAIYYLRTNWLYLLLGILYCVPVVPFFHKYLDRSENKGFAVLEMVAVSAAYIVIFVISLSYLLTSTSQAFLYFKF